MKKLIDLSNLGYVEPQKVTCQIEYGFRKRTTESEMLTSK